MSDHLDEQLRQTLSRGMRDREQQLDRERSRLRDFAVQLREPGDPYTRAPANPNSPSFMLGSVPNFPFPVESRMEHPQTGHMSPVAFEKFKMQMQDAGNARDVRTRDTHTKKAAATVAQEWLSGKGFSNVKEEATRGLLHELKAQVSFHARELAKGLGLSSSSASAITFSLERALEHQGFKVLANQAVDRVADVANRITGSGGASQNADQKSSAVDHDRNNRADKSDRTNQSGNTNRDVNGHNTHSERDDHNSRSERNQTSARTGNEPADGRPNSISQGEGVKSERAEEVDRARRPDLSGRVESTPGRQDAPSPSASSASASNESVKARVEDSASARGSTAQSHVSPAQTVESASHSVRKADPPVQPPATSAKMETVPRAAAESSPGPDSRPAAQGQRLREVPESRSAASELEPSRPGPSQSARVTEPSQVSSQVASPAERSSQIGQINHAPADKAPQAASQSSSAPERNSSPAQQSTTQTATTNVERPMAPTQSSLEPEGRAARVQAASASLVDATAAPDAYRASTASTAAATGYRHQMERTLNNSMNWLAERGISKEAVKDALGRHAGKINAVIEVAQNPEAVRRTAQIIANSDGALDAVLKVTTDAEVRRAAGTVAIAVGEASPSKAAGSVAIVAGSVMRGDSVEETGRHLFRAAMSIVGGAAAGAAGTAVAGPLGIAAGVAGAEAGAYVADKVLSLYDKWFGDEKTNEQAAAPSRVSEQELKDSAKLLSDRGIAGAKGLEEGLKNQSASQKDSGRLESQMERAMELSRSR